MLWDEASFPVHNQMLPMNDYSRIIEDIQAAVLSPEVADQDYLRETAVEYSLACDEANRRLKECYNLLKRGLRSEAFQLADQEPNLLNTVGLLDFPELPAWNELLTQLQMVLPTPLQIDLAAELNEAYASIAPLAGLMRSHRLLALGRSPLAARIRTLRALCVADEDNPIWPTDLQLLEAARLRQIQGEASAAAKQEKLELLQQLFTEVTAPDWQVRPTPETVRQVGGLLSALTAKRARTILHELEQPLLDAYAAFDLAEAQDLASQWQTAAEAARLTSSDPLAMQVAPALKWVAEQEEQLQRHADYDRAVALLVQALDEEASREKLDRLYHNAIHFEEGLDPLIERRFRERMAAFDLAHRRMFGLRMAGVVGLLLLAAGATFWYVQRQQREKQIVARVSGLSELVNAAEDPKSSPEALKEAQAYADKTESEGLGEDPRLQAIVAHLHELQIQEKNRAEGVSTNLKRVADAGVENPDLIALNNAEKAARTLEEREAIAAWQQKFREAERVKQRKRDETFLAKFTEVREQFEALDQKVSEMRLPPQSEFDTLNGNIDLLVDRSTFVTSELVNQAKALRLRSKALLEQVNSIQLQLSTLESIDRSIGSLKLYRDNLETFTKSFSKSAESAELTNAMTEFPLWESAESWRAFYAQAGFQSQLNLTPAEAQKLLEEGKTLLEKHPTYPGTSEFTAKQAVLNAIVERKGKERPILEELKELFLDKMILGAKMLETDKGERFYGLQAYNIEEKSPGENITISYITGFDLAEKRKLLAVDSITFTGPAPQAELAEDILQKIQEVSDFTWEVKFYEMMKLVLDQEKIDPVLKLTLLKRVVSLGSKGSHGFKVATTPVMELLSSSELDLAVNWIVPGDKEAEISRERATAVMKRLPNAMDLRSSIQAKLRGVTRPPELPPVWEGWLWRTPKGTLEARKFVPNGREGTLFVLSPTGPKFAVVAQVKANSVEWNNSDPSLLLTGRPLYFRESASPEEKPSKP